MRARVQKRNRKEIALSFDSEPESKSPRISSTPPRSESVGTPLTRSTPFEIPDTPEPEPEEEEEEKEGEAEGVTEDPYFAALAAKAKIERRERKVVPKGVVVELFLDSPLPKTQPVIIKYMYDKPLEEAMAKWCELYARKKEETVFLWRGTRVWGWASCAAIGVELGDDGTVAPPRGGAMAARWFTPLGKLCVVAVAASAAVQGWVLVGSVPL